MHSANDMLGAMAGQVCGGPPLQDNGEEFLCSALPEGNFEARMMDWDKAYYGKQIGKVLDKDKACEAAKLEIESTQRLEVYEPIDLAEPREP